MFSEKFTLYIVKVINTEQAEARKWYRRKGGKLLICRLGEDGNYRTFGFIDDGMSIGWIEPEFCKVISSFEYDDDDY